MSLNDFLSVFNNLGSNYLSDDDYKILKPCGSKPGVMYGLCKVHKSVSDDDPVPPFRPILSAIGTCTYNLAKFFVPVLKEFTVNEYTVKDSFSFCKEIVSQNSDLFMASFDVQSLFTNIPWGVTNPVYVLCLWVLCWPHISSKCLKISMFVHINNLFKIFFIE